MSSFLTNLECSRTGKRYDPSEIHHLSDAGAPLFARYDIDGAKRSMTAESLSSRPCGLWRFHEMLPVANADAIVSLGEGGTPLLRTESLGLERLFIKDESRNPTASFKSRGMAVAISMARALGATELATPSAGNAGGAMAAYAARAGLAAHVVLPRDVPPAMAAEAEAFGADVRLVDGLIGDAGRVVARECARHGWYDLSTLNEPYRVEGKKTMGYELFEQLSDETGGSLPDVILYPTGGGTGLVGMWKAFDEMEQLGWIDDRRPRMVAVQSTGCAPLARAMDEGAEECTPWEDAKTVCPGVRVPKPLGDFLILRALRASRGRAVAVSDESLLEGMRTLTRRSGVDACPEAGACYAALEKLVHEGWVARDETVVLFNTASGTKYRA